jgi:hypothetical protein
MSAHNHRFVAVSADNTVIPATGPTDSILGVQDDKPYAAAGAQVGVRHGTGPTLVEAGATFSAGAYLTSDGVGRAVTATTGQKFSAIATKPATGVGDYIACTLQTGVVP